MARRVFERPEFAAPSASRRSVVLAAGCLVSDLIMRHGRAAAQAGAGAATQTVAERRSAAAAFPLALRPGKRYLEDAKGRPFLINGDTAWSLIAQLTREDVDRYLDDRRVRGFNTILISLIERHYSRNPPANAYGQQPFRRERPGGGVPSMTGPDFTAPNEGYFAHADWVLRRAAAQGFLVLLAPSYVGCCGDGWYDDMVANGPDRLRAYGEYLGRRYRDYTNILWVHSGDANPPEKDLVRAIANGIRKFDPGALHTVHGAPWTHAVDYWARESWLQVYNIYTAHPDAWDSMPVYAAALEHYARPEWMPFFLIEGVYENEHGANEQFLRTQAYQALLSGAGGHVFGNNPIWHFDTPGLGPPMPVTWQEALDSPGAQSMTHLHDLLASTPWRLLEPDSDHTLLTDGLGPKAERAVAARVTDGSLAIVYLPESREITIDLGQLAGPDVAARWYDPAGARSVEIAGAPFPATGPRGFRPPPNNSSGFDDWVLVLESPA